MMKWSRERIESLLVGTDLNVPMCDGCASLSSLTKFEGDSSVSTRKGGKKFGCFDLRFTVKWTGDGEGAEKFFKLVSALEDDEDVQTVTSNVDITEEVFEQIG